MTIAQIQGFGEIRPTLMAFALTHGSHIPTNLVSKFYAATGAVSPVDAISFTTEFMFANREALTEANADAGRAARVLGVQCIQFAMPDNLGQLGNERGSDMLSAMLRELGEVPPTGDAWPAPENDPTPSFNWMPDPVVYAEPATG